MLASRPSGLAHVAKVSDRKLLKILTPKQMLQRLPIALAQVKAVNTSENMNEIKQIIYYQYLSKKNYQKRI